MLADPSSAAAWIFDRLAAAGAEVMRGADPCALPKACKNAVEIDGARAAHRRDGAAVTRFLCWLAEEAPKGKLTETRRGREAGGVPARPTTLIRDFSFDTISGAGPNGAIVHYRVIAGANRPHRARPLYLVDSGAQYLDGTTDITRTVDRRQADGGDARPLHPRAQGPYRARRGAFPQGHHRQPARRAGARLRCGRSASTTTTAPAMASAAILGVHEGPQRISKVPNRVALEPGMIVSNEPGYYKTGDYGIRIENLVVVTEVKVDGAERPMLGFETLTLAPIDRALIEPSLLTPQERAWVDAYHARVRAAITPLVDAKTAAWLKAATEKL